MAAPDRHERREQRRRETRRRRMLALAGLIAVAAVAVAVAALASGGSGGSHGASTLAAHASHAVSPAGAGSAGGTSRAAAASDGAPGHDAVPILMYHVIAAPPTGAPFPGLYVEPQLFAEQMQALKAAGWHAVTPDQVAAYWRKGVSLGPGKPIVLSFDNGYHSQYANAMPVLRQLGWVGEENLQLTGLPPSQGGLSEAEVRGLLAAGWELDTQGISHADLITLDPQQLHYQVAVARETIQRRYHVPANWFCYPSGHYDEAVVDEVKAAGFEGSTTVVPGWAGPESDPYRLPRLRVLGGTSPQALLAEIAAIRDDAPPPASYPSS